MRERNFNALFGIALFNEKIADQLTTGERMDYIRDFSSQMNDPLTPEQDQFLSKCIAGTLSELTQHIIANPDIFPLDLD